MRPCREDWFPGQGGHRLFYRHWPAESEKPRGGIVLLHRGHEHSGRIAHLVDELDLSAFDFFAFDARGHGRSKTGPVEAPGVGTLVADIEGFVRHLRTAHEIKPGEVAVIAASLSAVLTAAWVHDYAPGIRAMVLAAPAFRIRLYVPFARTLLTLVRRMRGECCVKSYVQPRHLTRDPDRIAAYASDSLITHTVPVRLLLGLDRLARRVLADAGTITVPTQILTAGRDLVVDARRLRRFFHALGSREKSFERFPGLLHDLLGERERGPVMAAVRRFLLERFAVPDVTLPGTPDPFPYTQNEAERLQAPLHRFSLRAIRWRAVRALLAAAGRFSKGIAIGRRTGFDSGESLDYVYRNEAAGRGPIGRTVDRLYLDTIGWRCIRERKTHLEAAIREAVASLRAAGQGVRIVDIAAGRGRYLLDALGPGATPDAIELRDHSMASLRAARALLVERGLANIATCQQVDAFAAPATGQGNDGPRPKPFTLAIVSGLYELYADNAPVRRSLDKLAAELAPGAYLIYTGQPWHPQLELIARVLTRERDGAPWVMRRRPQAELDALVEAAGFEKLRQCIDEEGIFTVSVARKRGAPAYQVSSGERRLEAIG